MSGTQAARWIERPRVRGQGRTERQRESAGWVATRLVQLAIVVLVLLAWQYLPTVDWLAENFRIFDRFYISSPSEVGKTLGYLFTGSHGIPLLWPYLKTTVLSAVVGSVIGLFLGATFGLIFSNSPTLSRIGRPFIVVLNSVPRVALIPIFILLVGPTIKGSALNVVFTVFFLAFFNAIEGGSSVRASMLDNAVLLGAGRIGVMWYVRRPVVIAWTLATVPNAISFGLVVAVTAELLAGIPGMGYLLLTSTTNVQSALTFAVVVVLSVVGVVLFGLASLLRNRILHWQGK